MDGNDEDEKACVIDIQNTRRISRVYGCEADYEEYIQCMKEEADCESEGRYDYWTDEGECNDDLDDYLDCLSDESDVIGGSGGGDYDTGGWDWPEEEEEEEAEEWSGSDSCWYEDMLCIAANEPDNEAWCYGVGLEYSADPCSGGYYGVCAIPAGGDYTSPATAYYYEGFDESSCEGAGGTYTEY